MGSHSLGEGPGNKAIQTTQVEECVTATKLPDQISIHPAEAILPFQGLLHKQRDVIHGLPINTRNYKCHVLAILVPSNRRTVHDSKCRTTTRTSLIWFPFALLSHSLTVTVSRR